MNKRSVILLGALALLLVYFWSDSRVPQLQEKTANVGSSLTEAFTDRPIFDVVTTWPLWRKTLTSTVNWLNTNMVGMTAGVVGIGAFIGGLLGAAASGWDLRYSIASVSLMGTPLPQQRVGVGVSIPLSFGRLTPRR